MALNLLTTSHDDTYSIPIWYSNMLLSEIHLGKHHLLLLCVTYFNFLYFFRTSHFFYTNPAANLCGISPSSADFLPWTTKGVLRREADVPGEPRYLSLNFHFCLIIFLHISGNSLGSLECPTCINLT